MTDTHDRQSLAEIWQRRFDFFDRYGLPASSPESKAAFKAIPFGSRFRLTANFPAFFFGPIYFFVKGMWQKGLTLVGVWVVFYAVFALLNLPDSAARGAGIGLSAATMSIANYAYYLHYVKGSQSWNLFEGFGKRR
ncbi:DUF2628 domain-containing protein [Mycobacteroides franklinii]|uniref:DUF2628 domain-containing protein n=1 Tax=Mycobacteroides franklinii TaxID=948102 RepID=A0A4R8R094_9MYCO|nr:DUF2628 domain-containing protein [Mycobacteroides franklinii]ORA60820.1 hypothetical protein BST24_11540 [Mycobacteroides franklinii]TDZ40886.1 hypothetical protein CCUG64054_04846 [Mycobacteroides franklinii]TDZ49472.1 hypothetical protein CCUG63697_04008 [Mycobacteroides franklinii]TDZ54159.1 hypothetical protein CCUG63696_04841 [Mycobacteroides franklinii]TDZ60956.1 hypothetical protein CCUG63695_04826 [Mycobacteroides franklinii]